MAHGPTRWIGIFDSPGWYLGEGWALTPEPAGVAEEDHRGPGLAPIEGWIRRRREAVTLMIGGRNLGAGAVQAGVQVTIDDTRIEQLLVPPGFFLRFIQIPEGALTGRGRYARLGVTASSIDGGQPRVVVEQFNAQAATGVVFGFGDGWHEMETTGRGPLVAWMSERGRSGRAPDTGARLESWIDRGFLPLDQHQRQHRKRSIGPWTVDSQFAVQAQIPADAMAGGENALVIESDQFFVPAERSRRTQDRRHLALRVDDVRLTPVF